MMFERNPVDRPGATALAVEVRLTGGQTVSGRAALDADRPVHQLLAGNGDFLYIELGDGEADFIPKSAIAGLKIVKPIQPRPLRQPPHTGRPYDPAKVLDVAPDAPWGDIKAAYHGQLKLYHPDKFAGVELPPEVATYLEAKAKQITQAFQSLKVARAGRVAD